MGRVAQILSLEETTIVDSHVTILRANPDILTTHVFGLSIFERQLEIEGLGEGTTGQTELSRTQLGSLLTIIPPISIQKRFDRQVVHLRNKTEENNQQSRNLATLRDTLLPKLMSGEIRVGDAEKMVEDAA